ncbi:MAG: glycosyltransferase family 2 protein [Granulosicoccus sp.]
MHINAETPAPRLAVLLTCFNRCEDTLACLRSLADQQDIQGAIDIDVVLVDDGSTDGTAEQVAVNFPSTRILKGDGQLFWNGGMSLAFNTALGDNYDFYLWLNDDTQLAADALARLLSTHQSLADNGHKAAIVVGSTSDPLGKETTYGGVNSQYRWWPLKYVLQEPGDSAIECDTMNGNCVLIPKAVTQLINGLDPVYTHYLSDHDYGLRNRQAGGSVWIAPGYYGVCEVSKPLRAKQDKATIKQNIAALDTPKGLAIGDTDLTSFSEWKHYCKQHGGRLLWPIYWLAPYRRLIWQYLPGAGGSGK